MTTAPLEGNVRHELTIPAFRTAYAMFRAMPSKEPKEYHFYTIYNAVWNTSVCNDYSKRDVILSILSHDMNDDIRKLALEKLETMKG